MNLYAAMYRALANLQPGETITRQGLHDLRCKYMGQADTSHGVGATNAALDIICQLDDSVYRVIVNDDGVRCAKRV